MKYTTFLKRTLSPLFFCISISSYLAAPPMPAGMPPFEISDKEMNDILSILQNLDDKELAELERQAEQVLQEAGFDPKTFKPLGENGFKLPEEEKAPPQEALVPKVDTNPVIDAPANIVREMPELLSSLIKRLDIARFKLPLGQWLVDTNTLINALYVINKPQHYPRLATAEYDKLRLVLVKLNNALRIYEPVLSMPINKPAEWEDPYEAIGLLPSANQEQIDQAYAQARARFDPKAVRERFKQAGWNQREIKKAVRESRVNLDFVTDAYEKIKDAPSRALINQELQALQSATLATSQSFEAARQAITAALSTAIFQDQVLAGLEQFIKKYEPEEQAQRKQMEQAEAERLKEHKASAAAKPYSKTIHIRGAQTKPDFSMPWDRQSPSASAGMKPASAHPAERPAKREKPEEKPKSGGPTKSGGKAAKKPEDKDKKEEDKDKNAKKAANAKKAPGAKDESAKSDKKEEKSEEKFDAIAQQLLDLDQQFFTFNEHFDGSFFENVQATQPNIEQLAPDVSAFAKSTHLNDLAEKLTYVEKSLKKAEERQIKQYKTLWKGISKNTEKFEKNLASAQKAFESYPPTKVEDENSASVKSVSASVKQASDSLKKIQEAIGEKKKLSPTEQLFVGLAPRV